MPIPDLQHGMLPPGIHNCSLEELRQVFGQGRSSVRRAELWEKFVNYCEWVATFPFFSAIYVDGSFTTAEEEPGDVDVVIATELGAAALGQVFKDNQDAVKTIIAFYTKSEFEVHPFIHFSGSADFVDFFQTVRPETAQKRGLPRDYRKGLLRVQL